MANLFRGITPIEFCIYAAQVAVAVFVWSSLTGTDLSSVLAIVAHKL